VVHIGSCRAVSVEGFDGEVLVVGRVFAKEQPPETIRHGGFACGVIAFYGRVLAFRAERE